jgi:DNA-binding transcriptional MocR family regulator
MAQARYKHVVDAFSEQIRSGKLPPGTRLPTHRALSAKHGIALVTATRVYAELETMGLVIGETGRGTFVRETAVAQALGIDQRAIADDMVDLNFNYPSLPGQAEILRTALRQLALSGDLDALLRYQPHGGRPHERAIFARYLAARGLKTDANSVVIVDGAQHGLATTCMALLNPGDVVAADYLTYPGIKVLAAALKLELVSIPPHGDGTDLDFLEQLCNTRPVRAVYVQPTVHNPLGWVMSAGQRQGLVSLARHHGVILIEDAPYAFLDEHAPPPLANLAPELTVHVSGFSKSAATGLRVGLVATHSAWIPRIERAIRATTWNTPGVMTAIVCGWLEDGTISRFEAEKRRDAKRRQAVVTEIFGKNSCVRHPVSYFAWLPLSEAMRADRVEKELLSHRISVSTAEPFAVSNQAPQAIRIALGSVDIDKLRYALSMVKGVIENLTY